MTVRQRAWSWSAVAFVVAMAILGTLVERATNRVAQRLERATGWVDDRGGADEFVRSMGREGFFASAAPWALAISGMWMMNLLWLRVESTSVLKIE